MVGIAYIHLVCDGQNTAVAAFSLHACMLSILSLHVHALCSGRIHLQLCVTQLEGVVLYYGMLLAATLFWNYIGMQAGLYLCWHVWQNAGRDWLPSPWLMRASLSLCWLLFVPLASVMPLASWEKEDGLSRYEVLMGFLVCDAVLALFQGTIRLYAMAWQAP
jgi:hypothetical protein